MAKQADTLIMDNIIMDEKKPTAEAALVGYGAFAFIGHAEKVADPKIVATIMDGEVAYEA